MPGYGKARERHALVFKHIDTRETFLVRSVRQGNSRASDSRTGTEVWLSRFFVL